MPESKNAVFSTQVSDVGPQPPHHLLLWETEAEGKPRNVVQKKRK